jgi:hypothetical protein
MRGRDTIESEGAWHQVCRQSFLVKGLNLRVYLSQCSFKRGAAASVRCSLRKDALALKIKGLPLALACGALVIGHAPGLVDHEVTSVHGHLVTKGICHFHLDQLPLFLFPRTSYGSIL